MCNPRRVTITATRELAEAWQREITRTAHLSTQVVGEARLRQSLASTLGVPALRALEISLGEGVEDWRPQEDGSFRHEVEGGYALYHPESQELEIVALREAAVEATESVSETLAGSVETTVSAEGEGRYYDDEWGGNTRQRAEQTAEQQAAARLAEEARLAVERQGDAAVAAAADQVQARADAATRARLEQVAAARRAELEEQARRHLETVGVRCRQAFHQLLARAYRNALLSFARSKGAEVTTNRETGDVIDIELQWGS